MIGRSRGASLLVPVLIVITVGAFGVVVVASQAGGDIASTDADAQGIEALALAEAGLERALKRFAAGTACAALGETISDLSAFGVTGRTIVIGNGLGTDFASTPLQSSLTQCRVPVTARIDASNVSRSIHAIVDRNLLGGPRNYAFDNPAAGAPSAWTLTPAAGYAVNGGPDGVAPACSRAAWLVKTTAGNTTETASGQASVNFTLTGGSTTTVAFHYRITDRGTGCGGIPAGPADLCGGAAGREGSICFRATDSGGTNSTSGTLNADATGAVGNVACPIAFDPCDSGYQGGYPVKSTVAMTMGGAGTRTISTFGYFLRLQRNGRREMFLDHIEAINDTALGAARVQLWRDCSMSSCPPT